MNSVYVDPFTRKALEADQSGDLFCLYNNERHVYGKFGECYDFTTTNPEATKAREVYNELYGRPGNHRVTQDRIMETWADPTIPWRKTLLESIGEVAGKRILLLGNGKSVKELYFLTQGANVVYTDLSIAAVLWAKSVFDESELWREHHGQIEFHAVDGMHMPFQDCSFDIILGTKVVGFISDRPSFFSEVGRCLKPNGVCRFVEDAYSPAWNAARYAWRPIKVHVLWKRMSDLNRLRSGGDPSGSFGFRKESLVPYVRQCGFTRLVFIRGYFLLRVAQFFLAKTLGWETKMLPYLQWFFLVMRWIDERLAGTAWMQRNSLSLVFGFDK
jgi:SAM-dependent methyltransferase